ncbi:hypothetical protein BO79DRAFT_251328 [Aspergillus costaricaensis CBS 115574]|uniref:Uncharacterized protein n=1 Tax=Aspergillus costaricaensis CBS 115574 TaxID=1448317 RepID=A0ACD1IR01_9EURO|nr:hypothetical protein BO79DRAFT_251328 [Aspergillus costaricaensis CBS 115574]RAK92822.1 hypothetical protein BO79DRAFT_251328 [Aspergillus costaricaensis CBS 115574]
MSSAPSQHLPADRTEWEKAVKGHELDKETIHGAELVSGSKIGYKQFLLLRVLWKVQSSLKTLPERIKRLIPDATAMLEDYPSWKTYCNGFGMSINPEGNFTIVRYYQQMAARTKGIIRPSTFDTPIALRTRNKLKEKVFDVSKLQLNSPKTPSTNPKDPPKTPESNSDDDDDDDDSLVYDQEEPEFITPAAQVPKELRGQLFPPTKDEQIVNTALVEASFEARTDGYLDDGNENAYALIEVKPVIRSSKPSLIQMQESAQMVGWLMNNGDTDIERLGIHISQNRHEIFLTIAEYDDDYVAYLKNKPPKSQNRGARN